MATINRKLNLVLSYPRENGNLYVHSIAISRQVFESYYRVISRTFSAIYTEIGGISAGPRIAALELKRAAAELGFQEADIQHGLIAEIQRLTSIIVLTDKGWETLPYHEAMNKKMLDEDEASEVENALAFFTVASRMHRKQDVANVLGVMENLWGAQIVYLNSTEFAASLQTLTTVDNSGVKVAA